MATTYSTEEADLKTSAAAIESLWARNLLGHGQASAHAKLELGYLDNPAERGTVILLRADGMDEAQGAQGLHPRRFHLGDRPMRAAGMADYVVNEGHRSLGPALLLMRHGTRVGAERFDFIFGFPNAKAAPVFVRAGLKQLGVVRRHAKLLTSRNKLARHAPAWMAAACAPMLDRALELRDWLRGPGSATRLDCTDSDWHDVAIDAIWNRRSPGRLLSERTSHMLRWRFGHPARGAWRICVARDIWGAPQGYVVWRVDDGFAEVGDFFSIDQDSQTMSLMLAFTRLMREARVRSISVEFFGSAHVEAQLRAAGWVTRPELLPVFTGRTMPSALPPQDAWYLTRFDSDAD